MAIIEERGSYAEVLADWSPPVATVKSWRAISKLTAGNNDGDTSKATRWEGELSDRGEAGHQFSIWSWQSIDELEKDLQKGFNTTRKWLGLKSAAAAYPR